MSLRDGTANELAVGHDTSGLRRHALASDLACANRRQHEGARDQERLIRAGPGGRNSLTRMLLWHGLAATIRAPPFAGIR